MNSANGVDFILWLRQKQKNQTLGNINIEFIQEKPIKLINVCSDGPKILVLQNASDIFYCFTKDQWIEKLWSGLHLSLFHYPIVFVNILIFLFGTTGNIFVCLSVKRSLQLRNVTNYFIVNLAIADFLVILICLPATVIWDLYLTWFFGTIPCKLIMFLQDVSISVSVLTLTAISIDRYYAICHPLKFKSNLNQAKRVIMLIWLVSFIIMTPDLLYLSAKSSPDILEAKLDTVLYSDCNYSWDEKASRMFQFVKTILLYLFPIAFMFCAHYRIQQELKRASNLASNVSKLKHNINLNINQNQSQNSTNLDDTNINTNTTSTANKTSTIKANKIDSNSSSSNLKQNSSHTKWTQNCHLNGPILAESRLAGNGCLFNGIVTSNFRSNSLNRQVRFENSDHCCQVIIEAHSSNETLENETNLSSNLAFRNRVSESGDVIETGSCKGGNCSSPSSTTANNINTNNNNAPFEVVSLSNSQLVLTMHNQNRLESRRRAAKMLTAIVIIFGICYFPVHLINFLRLFIEDIPQTDITSTISMLSHCICYLNSAINPIIYNHMNSVFRQEFKKFLYCLDWSSKEKAATTTSNNFENYRISSVSFRENSRDFLRQESVTNKQQTTNNQIKLAIRLNASSESNSSSAELTAKVAPAASKVRPSPAGSASQPEEAKDKKEEPEEADAGSGDLADTSGASVQSAPA